MPPAAEPNLDFDALIARLNAESHGAYGTLSYLGRIPFGASLNIERFRLANGLELLLCLDRTAPVFAYHSWYGVGSRHERVGKTGISHLFEHLMFNETEAHGHGAFDRILEEVGGENNASTWLDWTQYTIQAPSAELPLVVGLEAERMARLVLRDEQVASEKEVVANERRYRVDDDVDGTISERLWATAFTEHAYRWPTIGWMEDIQGFTTEDCREFYATYYSPNNAKLVVVGDVSEADLLRMVRNAYGAVPPATIPPEDVRVEPPQQAERRVELTLPTPTQKLSVAWHSPALGAPDHAPVTLLCELLVGGEASRLEQRLVRQLELAVDVSGWAGTFRHPSLLELSATARDEHTAEELLEVVSAEVERLRQEPPTDAELERVKARAELGLLAGLETAEGKAFVIGFDETVLGEPSAAFTRLEAMRAVTGADVLRVARTYLSEAQRTVMLVRPSGETAETDEDGSDEGDEGEGDD